MFHGSIPALITPFTNGEVDLRAFKDFVEWQIESGSHGVVSCGTTGESPVLDDAETQAIFAATVDVVKGRVPVIAGTGSNSTKKTIAMTNMARESGADAALIVTPYYNKPTQEGLFAHFKAIHDSTDLPIILYSVPARCIIELSVETIIRLAQLPRIVAIKDATTDASRTTLIKSQVKDSFDVFAGDDVVAGAFLAQGAVGCISVTANIAPAACAAQQNAWAAGRMEEFKALQNQLMPLHRALFTETSPAPVKYAASRLGLCSDEVRLPLVPASSGCRANLDKVMAECGLFGDTSSAKLRAHG